MTPRRASTESCSCGFPVRLFPGICWPIPPATFLFRRSSVKPSPRCFAETGGERRNQFPTVLSTVINGSKKRRATRWIIVSFYRSGGRQVYLCPADISVAIGRPVLLTSVFLLSITFLRLLVQLSGTAFSYNKSKKSLQAIPRVLGLVIVKLV